MITNKEDYAKRNERNNLVGTVICPICSKEFQFETNVNANGIITDVSTKSSIGISPHSNFLNYKTITHELISICPTCNCKFKYYSNEKIQK